jgi:hypothetical protein
VFPLVYTRLGTKEVQWVKFPNHKKQIRSHYSVTCNSSIPLKYHHFSTQSPTTWINLSHPSVSLKILSQQTSGSFICNCSQPLLLPHYMELVTSQVWLQWPQHMTPIVWRCMVKPQDAWSTSSQWNNCNNSCVQHVPCGVTLSRWRITSHARCPRLFPQTASCSDHIRSHKAFTLTAMPRGRIQCGWLLCIPENRCQNFSSRLTDFKLFASQRI